jgi:hypothetical protein
VKERAPFTAFFMTEMGMAQSSTTHPPQKARKVDGPEMGI